MASKFSRNVFETFSSALEEKEDWRDEKELYSLRDVVEDSFFLLEKALARGASWGQIAELLQTSVGEKSVVKAGTLRQYYCEAQSKKSELAKRWRRRRAKSKQANSQE